MHERAELLKWDWSIGSSWEGQRGRLRLIPTSSVSSHRHMRTGLPSVCDRLFASERGEWRARPGFFPCSLFFLYRANFGLAEKPSRRADCLICFQIIVPFITARKGGRLNPFAGTWATWKSVSICILPFVFTNFKQEAKSVHYLPLTWGNLNRQQCVGNLCCYTVHCALFKAIHCN